MILDDLDNDDLTEIKNLSLELENGNTGEKTTVNKNSKNFNNKDQLAENSST